eukprot:3854847-Pyramimonas_sp.AAC.1
MFIVESNGISVLPSATAIARGPGSAIPKREITPSVFMPDVVSGVGGLTWRRLNYMEDKAIGNRQDG